MGMDTQVLAFLRKNILVTRRSGACREIVLRHLAVGKSSGAEVSRWEIEPHHLRSEEAVRDLQQEILLQAMSDAAGLGATQTYVLLAYHGDSDKYTQRQILRIDGDDNDDDDTEGFSSEPATAKGALAMQMRHNQAIMKTSVAGMAGVMQTLQRALARTTDRLEKLEDDKIKNLDAFERLMTASHERDLSLRKAETREKMIGELMTKAQVLLPVIANKIAGKDLMPAPVKESLQAFFSSMTPDQMQNIMGTLKDEQKIFLQEMIGMMQ